MRLRERDTCDNRSRCMKGRTHLTPLATAYLLSSGEEVDMAAMTPPPKATELPSSKTCVPSAMFLSSSLRSRN